MCGLLIAVAPLVATHVALGLAVFSNCDTWAQQLWFWSPGSKVVVHGLSCSTAYGIFPDQESNPCFLPGHESSAPQVNKFVKHYSTCFSEVIFWLRLTFKSLDFEYIQSPPKMCVGLINQLKPFREQRLATPHPPIPQEFCQQTASRLEL